MMKEKCFVNQTSVNDCGAACLAMMLKLNGISTSLDEIKKKMSFSSEGVSAYNIVKLANKKGLNVCGYKNISLNEIKTPAIAHTITENNTQHFVVILSVLGDRVLIADPADKIKYVKKEEFLKKYTKIVIMQNDEINIRKEILKNKSLVIKILLITIILVFLNLLFSCLVPYSLKFINDKNSFYIIILFFMFIGGIKDILSYIKATLLVNFKIITDKFITIPTVNKIINLPRYFYNSKGAGELISKINDLSYIKEIIFSIIEVLIINSLFVVTSIIILSFLDLSFLLINILYIIALYLLNKSFLKKYFNNTYDFQVSNDVLNNSIVDTFNSINMIKNLSKEDYFNDKITNVYNKTLKKYKKTSHLYLKKELINSILVSYFTIFTLLVLILKKYDTPLILFAFSVQGIIINSLTEIFNLFSSYADYKSVYKRTKEIFEYKNVTKTQKSINIQNIHFQNIWYKFRSEYILKNISLDIKKGDWLMVSGKTATGKSTLFKLLLKQLSLEENDIFINNVNIKDINDSIIRNSITYVDQKVKLFNASIKENIFMDKCIDKKVLKTALIYDLLKESNISLDYVIDNTNSNISVGGMYKIAIAQALTLNKDVIIFDETTSNLDIKTEEKILKNIKKNYKDKTIILITHRKSNIKYFNKLVFLEKGNIKIKERGEYGKINKKRNEKY